ncbi:hypothetical protein [Flavobacterium anhuiense]|uniref:hypothetical protein n=1 Tax=Flavobacterium anhuiense TaxID=459526 RepID=UPI0034D98588
MKKIFLLIFIPLQTFMFSQTFELGTNSLKWTREQKDFNSPPRVGVADMSLKLWDNYTGANAPSQFGTLLEIYGQHGHLISHLYFNNNWDGGQIMYRSAFYGQDTWGEWRNLLDSKSDVVSSGILKIGGTGNSGIGTNNPEKKFQIDASNTDAGLRIHAAKGDNNTSTPYLLLTGGYLPNNGVALRGIGDANYGRKALVFYSGWDGNTDNPAISDLQERMRISSNGNVGIGTMMPNSKLTVAGNIHSREVKVTVNAGADFVFEKDYDLPSLESVDKFIKENKHLPEITSAEEMKKDGINLSEMNIKLLQKIEEMTLYMIEMKKQNDLIIRENELLKKDHKLMQKRIQQIESKQ